MIFKNLIICFVIMRPFYRSHYVSYLFVCPVCPSSDVKRLKKLTHVSR